MANRLFQQFFHSFTKNLVGLHGSVALAAPVAGSLVNQGITYTADAKGAAGNSITIAITVGGTAGAEVVTVVGNAISVQIEAGVSTRTQVKTALDSSVPAAALIGVSVTSGATAVSSALAATALAGGSDGTSSFAMNGVATVVLTGVGEYTFTLSDKYSALESVDFTLLAATAVDLVPQVKSVDVTSAKTIVVRLLAAATPTDVSAAAVLYMALRLRNSSVSN